MQYPDHGQVAVASEILSQHRAFVRRQRINYGAQIFRQPVACFFRPPFVQNKIGGLRVTQNVRDLVLTVFNDDARKIPAGTPRRHAVQFLGGGIAVKGANPVNPRDFLFRRPFFALGKANPLEQPVAHGFVKRTMQQFIGQISLFDVLAQRVERVFSPVVGRDDHDFAAPDQQSESGFHHFGQIVVERRLVNNDQPLHTAQGTRNGR